MWKQMKVNLNYKMIGIVLSSHAPTSTPRHAENKKKKYKHCKWGPPILQYMLFLNFPISL